MDTIDLTPTWTAIMPAIIDILIHGNEDGRKTAREELMDLAKKVDAMNSDNKGKE